MKFIYRIYLFLFAVIFFAMCNALLDNEEEAKQEEWAEAGVINQRLGRGINLGNALEAPKEGDWGVVLQSEYFRLIKEAGFNSVRIPVRWSAHAKVDSPFTIDPSFMERVSWAVNQAFANGLLAVINIHHYDELFTDPPAHKQRFLALWRQIAERFQQYSQNLLFEILNEPHDQLTPALWNDYLAEALTVIRKTNPLRTVIIGTANWGGIDALDELVLPDDDRLILTIHYYKPFQFTHQGAEWVSGSDAWLGTKWLGAPPEIQAIQQDFDRVSKWAALHSIPVFMGEFGAYHKADFASRVRWTSTVARKAEKRNFSWAYWEFCAGFGIYDTKSRSWLNDLLRALIPR